MASKRKVTAQTRVKLSQAAKKRQRGLKGTPLGGKFLLGVHHSSRGRLTLGDDYGPKKPEPGPGGEPHKGPRNPKEYPRHDQRTKHNFPEDVRQQGVQNLSDASRDIKNSPDRAAEELAFRRTRDRTGRSDLAREEQAHAPVRVSQASRTEVLKSDREAHWREPQTFARGERKSPVAFMKELETTAPSMKAELDQQLQSEDSVFTRRPPRQPGQAEPASHGGKQPPYVRRRLQTYTDARQQGVSHDEAMRRVEQTAVGSGRPRKAPTRTRSTGKETTTRKKVRTRKSRYESGTPSPDDFQFGISAGHIDKLDELRKNVPDSWSEAQVIRAQQTQRESIFNELQKNQKWAHETRRANVLNSTGGKTKEDDDRVVFFTTNLGSPAPSVPSDSLIGQYIIRKRVQMMKQAGIPKSQLRGKFPEATRDMHLFEMSTGLQYAAEGRQGAYKQTGWRYRNKSHGGYGKPVPVGSQLVYDSQGAPVYDKSGNIMFTEGATRPFRVNTPLAGLRIFIG